MEPFLAALVEHFTFVRHSSKGNPEAEVNAETGEIGGRGDLEILRERIEKDAGEMGSL